MATYPVRRHGEVSSTDTHERDRPMDRRRWWRSLALAVLVLLAWLITAPAAVARPNIVFVMTDDMDAGSLRFMREVSAVARDGALFRAAYVASPICVPSRATILTGKYPQNTRVRSNREPHGGYRPFVTGGQEQDTVAVWLQRAGYRTAMIGKYFNYYPEGAAPLHVPPGWTRWVVPESQAYMHAKYQYTLNEDGRRIAYGNRKEDYSTDVYAAKARSFIDAALDRKQPFALFLWPPSPHVREVPAVRHAALFPTLKVPRQPAFPEFAVADKPPFMRLPVLSRMQVMEIDARFRDRTRMLQSVDEAVASIRRLLRARGQLTNTYIVFSSDNGWHQGEHNQMPGKGRPYEEDISVPLVVAGPGIARGHVIDRLVGNADLAPTFADWAGIRPGRNVDGRSFARLARAAESSRLPWRRRLPIMRAIEGKRLAVDWPLPPRRTTAAAAAGRYACLERLPRGGERTPEYRGLRSERYTYVEHATGDRELYDNLRDPAQLENLACSAPADLLETLHDNTQALFNCRRAGCRAAENALPVRRGR